MLTSKTTGNTVKDGALEISDILAR